MIMSNETEYQNFEIFPYNNYVKWQNLDKIVTFLEKY